MKQLFSWIFFFISIFSISIQCQAKYIQTCEVKYERQDDWSKAYTVDVHFLTGYELNEATSSFDYKEYSLYAIIFWGEGKATVIKIEGYNSCSDKATKECVQSPMPLKGKDQEERMWKICLDDYCN